MATFLTQYYKGVLIAIFQWQLQKRVAHEVMQIILVTDINEIAEPARTRRQSFLQWLMAPDWIGECVS